MVFVELILSREAIQLFLQLANQLLVAGQLAFQLIQLAILVLRDLG